MDQNPNPDATGWYTRREGKVRGPYSPDEVTRYILLGRIRLGDELGQDGRHWKPVMKCTQLLPEELSGEPSWEHYQRLVMARVNADERRVQRRREVDGQSPPPGVAERRRGTERRRLDSNMESFACHLMGMSGNNPRRERPSPLRTYLLTTLLLTLLLAWFSTVFR
jgi:hypothetical protein